MQIILNGQKKEVNNNTSINELLQSFQKKTAVVVELNGNICTDTSQKLADNDKVEIVTFVGGG